MRAIGGGAGERGTVMTRSVMVGGDTDGEYGAEWNGIWELSATKSARVSRRFDLTCDQGQQYQHIFSAQFNNYVGFGFGLPKWFLMVCGSLCQIFLSYVLLLVIL